ncbi:hypothetical protein [Orenia marismortui]|uniref:Uncharacterized protein n=1 Tax=Orenia marismortui TaxID=46469 RepID=A0A4R8GX23_9FIRM|nr:hypothetical protein [Orenia marismortui]TDX48280.1 hypothetical protein C7959_1307 [Orenia marismortui]
MMRIFNKSNVIKHVGDVSLNIGANVVKEEEWAKVKKHPVVKGWLDMGTVEVEEGDLSDINEIKPISKAVEVIESTFDEKQLLEWKEQADRKGVKEAIDKQIAYLNEEGEGDE